MGMYSMMNIFSFIPLLLPATLLLTLSFFVLFTLRKVESQILKAFGYIVVGLIWITALLIFSSGIYSVSSRISSPRSMMEKGMRQSMSEMSKEGKTPMMKQGCPGCKKEAMTKDMANVTTLDKHDTSMKH